MKRTLKIILIVGIHVGALLLAFAVFFLMPICDVLGLSGASFDEDARDHLPKSASRILRYTDFGFGDSANYLAFTDTKESTVKEIESLCGRAFSDLDDLTHSSVDSFSRPSRNGLRYKGYWDIDLTKEGKVFLKFEGGSGVDILVDTERWRVFVHSYST